LNYTISVDEARKRILKTEGYIWYCILMAK